MQIVSAILSWVSVLLFFFWFALSPNLVLARQVAAACAIPPAVHLVNLGETYLVNNRSEMGVYRVQVIGTAG